jgi:formate/nitrite transporter
MPYVTPAEVLSEAITAAERKAALPVWDLLVRGVLAGVLLGYATSLVFVTVAQGVPPIVGALLFPVGFVILVLLGCELATGNFALLTQGLMAGRLSVSRLARNWAWVYVGNLVGSVLYAALFVLAFTAVGTSDGGSVAESIRQVAQKKTLAYMALGGRGLATAFLKGLLCNWMVTMGTILAFASRSTIGKIVAMWLPIFIFFAHGYEHSIVNMFLIPSGMMLGAPISPGVWWLWNQVPVTLGNIVGGAVFTGMALYVTHRPPASVTREGAPAPAKVVAAATR